MFRTIGVWLAHYIWCDRHSVPSPRGLTASVQIGGTAVPPCEADLHLAANDEAEVCFIVDHLARLGTVSYVTISDNFPLGPLAMRRIERSARRARRHGLKVTISQP